MADLQYDVCIIGAGAAGAYLAKRLLHERPHLKVLIVDAGPSIPVGMDEVDFSCEQHGDTPYRAPQEGRFFGRGGTTSAWGASLVPYSRKDFDVEDALSTEWKSIVQDLDLSAVSTLKHLGFEGSDLLRQSFEVSEKIRRHPLNQINQIELQRNIYLPFTKKNFAWMLDELANVPGAQVMLDSVVTKLNLEGHSDNPSKSVKSITIQTRSGDQNSITARAVLICQGAIETTRTLLEIAHQQGDDYFQWKDLVGNGLSDHISFPVANYDSDSTQKIAQVLAPSFVEGSITGTRMVPLSRDLPRSFAHVVFKQNGAAFTMAREMMYSIQSRKMPSIDVSTMGRSVIGLARFAKKRLLDGVLCIENGSTASLQYDFETPRSPLRRIELSEARDAYGKRKPSIHWSLSDIDLGSVLQRLGDVRRQFQHSLDVDCVDSLSDGEIALDNPYDVYHPCGTTPRGSRPSQGVLDEDLSVHQIANLWACSTAVLPSAGTANPTFSLLCLLEQRSIPSILRKLA